MPQESTSPVGVGPRTYTDEEIFAEHRKALAEGRVPFATPSPVDGPVDGVFTTADLDEGGPEPVRYEVPGWRGKVLWIHPVTPDQYSQIIEWGIRAPSVDESQTLAKLKLALAVEQQRHEMELRVIQVICCARVSAAPNAPRCFKRADAEKIGKRLGYQVVLEICRISDEMSGGDEMLGQSARRFFSLVARICRTCSSRSGSSTDSPDGWSATLTECGLLASRLQQRGSVDSILSREIADLERSLG